MSPEELAQSLGAEVDIDPDELASSMGGEVDFYDSGQSQLAASLASGIRGAASVPKGIIGGTGAVASLIPGMQDNALQRAAKSMGETTEELTPINPRYQETFPTKAGSAIGQAAGQIGTMMVAAPLRVGAGGMQAIGLTTAGLMGAEQGDIAAQNYGITDPLKRAATIAGYGAAEAGFESLGGFGSRGFSEALLGRMSDFSGNALKKFAKTAAVEGLEEVPTGQTQDWLTMALAEEDPEKPGFSKTGYQMPPSFFSRENLNKRAEELALGAVGGSLFGGVNLLQTDSSSNQGMRLRHAANQRISELESKPDITPQEQAELSDLKEQDAAVTTQLQQRGVAPEAQEEILSQARTYDQTFAENLARVSRDAEAALNIQDQQTIGITEPAIAEAEANPDTQATAVAASAAQEELLNQSTADVVEQALEQTQALTDDALAQIQQPESLPAEREGGDQSRETAETGSSGGVLSETRGSEEGQVNLTDEQAVSSLPELNLDDITSLEVVSTGTSESDVYRRGDEVVKVAEEYNAPETMGARVRDKLLADRLLGDGQVRLEGYYRGRKGVLNPVFAQPFIEGRSATQQEIDNLLQQKGFVPNPTKKGRYLIESNGKIYEAQDLDAGNVLVDQQGVPHVIDASVFELETPTTEEKKAASNAQRTVPDQGTNQPVATDASTTEAQVPAQAGAQPTGGEKSPSKVQAVKPRKAKRGAAKKASKELAQWAESKLKEELDPITRKRVREFRDTLAPMVGEYDSLFSDVSINPYITSPSGIRILEDGSLYLNPKNLFNSLAIPETLDQSKKLFSRILDEEFRHSVALELERTSPEFSKNLEDVWNALPQEVQDLSAEIYQKEEGGRYADDWQARHEFFRQYWQNTELRDITENALREKGVLERLYDLIDSFIQALKRLQQGSVPEAKPILDRLISEAQQRADEIRQVAAEPQRQTFAPGLTKEQLPDFVETLGEAARSVSATDRWGDDKVFISDLYDQWKKNHPDVSLNDFKEMLAEARGRVQLGRLDLVEALNPTQRKKMNQSMVQIFGDNLSLMRIPAPKKGLEAGPIYRAGDETEVGIKPWSSWTRSRKTAESYQDNPGFGGETLRQESMPSDLNIYELDRPSRRVFGDMAEAIGLDRETGEDWFDSGYQYPWEESSKARKAFENSEFDAIEYTDDFPAGARTIVFTKPISDAEVSKGLAAGPVSPPAESRLREISDWFAGTVYGDQAEGMEPQRSREMEREYAATGEAAGGYYNPRSESEQAARTDELVGLASGLYGGYSQEYGQALLSMIRRGTTLARGVAVNPFLSMNVLKWMDSHPDLRTLMKVDPQQYAEDYKRLSLLIGSSLQTFANSVYAPLRAMQDKADEVTDKAMGQAGISDPMVFSGEVLTPLEQDLKDIAEEFNTDVSKALLLEGAVRNMENTRDTTQEEEEAILTFSDWVMEGDVKSSGIGTFDDTILAHVTGNGFNAGAFALSLQQKFQNLPDEIAASIAERISARLAGQEVEEQEEVPEPNYDARAKRIVANSVAADSMPKTEKEKDAINEAVKKRLNGTLDADEFQSALEKLGVELETAFALGRKVTLDITRRLNAKKKEATDRYLKQAKGDIERLALQFSDTPAFSKENKSKLTELKDKFLNRTISRSDFVRSAGSLKVPEGVAEQMATLLDEARRRSNAVKTFQEEQRRLAEPVKTLDSKVDALAKELSDTLPAATGPKTAMQTLLEGFRNRTENRSSLLTKGIPLGASESTLNRFADLVEENQRRTKAIEDAKRRMEEEEKFEKEAQKKVDQLSSELSDTRVEPTKSQSSELSRLIVNYSDGKIDAKQLREFSSKLKVSDRTLDQLISLIDENNRRKKAAAKGEKEIAYDTFAKRLADRLLVVKKESERATSAVKRLTDAYQEGKLTKRQYLDHLMERGVMPQTALNLASAAGKKMREQVQKARQKAIDKVMTSLSPKKTPDPAKRSRFANLLMTSLEAGIFDSQAVRNAFSEAFDLHGVTQERIEQMAALLKKIEIIRDGIVRDKLMGDFNRLMNTIAPSSTVVEFLMDAYRGSVLGGFGTILAQFSGLTRLLNPFQAAQQTLWRMSDKRILSNPANFWRVWSTIAKEGFTATSMARSGVKGLISGETAGIGASPTDLSQVSPVNMRIGLMGARELGQYRSSLKGPFRWLAYPAWWSNRSYNFIRAAEAWTGTIDKNLEFRALAVDNLMQKQGMKFQEAWNTVSDLLSEQKNSQMWSDARDVAKKELEQGLITREQLRERSNEIVQDRLDSQWNGAIGNQHREMSAFLNYKQQPVTFAGDLLYSGFTKAARAVPVLDFMFLFPRFFVNNFERAFFNSFFSFAFTPFIQTNGDQKYLSERQKRIVRIYGSLEAYKTYRQGAAVSGVTNQFAVGMMMALAYGLAHWLDDDDDELPPPFWLTGQPPQKDFTKQKQMTLPGWWKPNTLYLRIPGTKKFAAFNYVQANPDLAVNLSMVGNIADRFMFSELLNYKMDPRTKKRVEEPLPQIGFESVASATLAPMTRSTYQAYFDAIGDVQNGNFKKLAKLVGRPIGETAAGVGLIPAGGPVLRDVQKVVKDLANEGVPKTSKTATQAFMSGIPYAEAVGEMTGNESLTGVPMINAFGETVSPYSYFSMLSKPQDSSPAVRKAASLLNNLGLAKEGPKEYWVSGDVVEIAHDGQRFQMNFSQRAQALEAIGKRFASSLNANQKRLETLKKQGNNQEVQRMVNDLAKQARTTVLNQWRGRIPVLEGDEE